MRNRKERWETKWWLKTKRPLPQNSLILNPNSSCPLVVHSPTLLLILPFVPSLTPLPIITLNQESFPEYLKQKFYKTSPFPPPRCFFSPSSLKHKNISDKEERRGGRYEWTRGRKNEGEWERERGMRLAVRERIANVEKKRKVKRENRYFWFSARPQFSCSVSDWPSLEPQIYTLSSITHHHSRLSLRAAGEALTRGYKLSAKTLPKDILLEM